MSTPVLNITRSHDGLPSLRMLQEVEWYVRADGAALIKMDTGWGLAANPSSKVAVERVRVALRHAGSPIPIMCGSFPQLIFYAGELARPVERLFTEFAFSPRPITVVVPATSAYARKLAKNLGGEDLGLRLPASRTALSLCNHMASALTAPALGYPGGEIVRSFDDAYALVGEAMARLDEAVPWVAIREKDCFIGNTHPTVVGLESRGRVKEIRPGDVSIREVMEALQTLSPSEYRD